MTLHLRTVDADTLLSTPLEKTKYIVDGLIPFGVSMFCGSSKIGKSWLMLWLGLHVSRGFEVWGMTTERCDVLYLCLEDTVSRIQNRLFYLTEDAPGNLRFAVASHQIGSGFEEEIKNYVMNYPKTKLVIVDTFQKIRNRKGNLGKGGMYGDDYDDISVVKHFADDLELAIVLVHHLRKLQDQDDPFNQISGSTGITGAADTIFLLKKDSENGDMATLSVKGRDIEMQKLKLKFENRVWHLIERKGQEEMRKEAIPRFLYRLVDFMMIRKEWTGTATELIATLKETEVTASAVTRYLNRFYYDVLEPVGIGYEMRRTSSKRLIRLFLRDRNDGYDGKISVENLLSFPSQTVIDGYSDDDIVF